MVLETTKNRICMHQIIERKQGEMAVEGDMIVNDVKPDILNIINTNGTVCVYKKEISDGKVRIDGTINTYIIYLANDENSSIRTLNTVLDFTHIMDMEKCKAGMIFNEDIKIKNFECKVLNERKINIKAILSIEGTLSNNENIDVINEINKVEDIQILNSNKLINSVIGAGVTKVYAKDTLKINETDELAEIMKIKTRIINKNTKISYNKVLAKADMQVELLYLTEDNRVCNANMMVPVMGFIDIENINDDAKCNMIYNIKNIVIKPDTNDEQSVYVEIELEINCIAYEQKNINLIEDMYSIYSNLTFNQKQIESIIEREKLDEICNINKQISISEIGENKLYSVDVIPEINSSKVENSKILYDANLNLQILFDSENGLQSRTISVPFNFEISSDSIQKDDYIQTEMELIKDNFIITSDGNIDINIELQFSALISSKEKLNIIENVNLEECRTEDIYSMIIYFVKKGDTLWKIAKKFKSTIEDIARINGIEDINKIYPGEQLYIPKYIKKNIA